MKVLILAAILCIYATLGFLIILFERFITFLIMINFKGPARWLAFSAKSKECYYDLAGNDRFKVCISDMVDETRLLLLFLLLFFFFFTFFIYFFYS